MNSASNLMRDDVYARVTNEIVRAIEAGTKGFDMPWHRSGSHGFPQNAATRMGYQGINTLMLWAVSKCHGYASSHWATYRQWENLGAQVRKGEKASPVVYYKKLEERRGISESEAEERPRFVIKHSGVFNAEQVDGWKEDAPKAQDLTEQLAHVERFITAIGAQVHYGGDVACYVRTSDIIKMPNRERFLGTKTSSPTEAFYSVLLHEHMHWTGRVERLNRDLSGRFGSAAYAMEELVAELGAAFLCADLGISVDPRLDHAAYIEDWLSVLQGDKRAIFSAARMATRGCEFLKEAAGA